LERLASSSEESDGCAGDEQSTLVATSRLWRLAAVGALAAVGLLCVLGATRSSAQRAALGAAVGLSDVGAASAAQAQSLAAQELSTKNNNNTAPAEDLHDGNPCGNDEEEHLGLCYEKCAVLTDQKYAHRQSAWTCCNAAVCPPFSMMSCCKHNMGWCSGFDIAGMEEGKKICPHAPGVCLTDEELFLDVCYMKCDTLTGGAYPYRTASATCCKTTDASCMFEDGVKDGLNGNAITNATFDVGGGCNDDSESTHCKPHAPQESLTEA